MSVLDETLDDLGFASKPGTTKGRMYSSRFYHAELKDAVKHLMNATIGDDEPMKTLREDKWSTSAPYKRNRLRAELRKKVSEL